MWGSMSCRARSMSAFHAMTGSVAPKHDGLHAPWRDSTHRAEPARVEGSGGWRLPELDPILLRVHHPSEATEFRVLDAGVDVAARLAEL